MASGNPGSPKSARFLKISAENAQISLDFANFAKLTKYDGYIVSLLSPLNTAKSAGFCMDFVVFLTYIDRLAAF